MKYNNLIKIYDGRSFHSKLEARYAQHLDLLKRGKEIQDWSPQVTFRLHGKNGDFICKIIPDFLVVGKHGQEEIHETKSWATMTPQWRMKWKMLKYEYPEYKYKVVTHKDF